MWRQSFPHHSHFLVTKTVRRSFLGDAHGTHTVLGKWAMGLFLFLTMIFFQEMDYLCDRSTSLSWSTFLFACRIPVGASGQSENLVLALFCSRDTYDNLRWHHLWCSHAKHEGSKFRHRIWDETSAIRLCIRFWWLHLARFELGISIFREVSRRKKMRYSQKCHLCAIEKEWAERGTIFYFSSLVKCAMSRTASESRTNP